MEQKHQFEWVVITTLDKNTSPLADIFLPKVRPWLRNQSDPCKQHAPSHLKTIHVCNNKLEQMKRRGYLHFIFSY